jgi:hypothetical protein
MVNEMWAKVQGVICWWNDLQCLTDLLALPCCSDLEGWPALESAVTGCLEIPDQVPGCLLEELPWDLI